MNTNQLWGLWDDCSDMLFHSDPKHLFTLEKVQHIFRSFSWEWAVIKPQTSLFVDKAPIVIVNVRDTLYKKQASTLDASDIYPFLENNAKYIEY